MPEEVRAMRTKALEAKKKRDTEKNAAQKIKLILNVITPDNFDKKFGEIRGYLFEEHMTQKECFEKEIEYDPELHKLNDENMNEDILNIIVSNLFRKAQFEKEYNIFYGELCEKLIKLELDLKDQAQTKKNMRYSKFRGLLFEVCKQCFEKFFEPEEKEKSQGNLEKQLIF